VDCKHCHGEHDVMKHAERKPLHESGQKCSLCDQVDRDAHLAWAKKRALACLPNSPQDAVASMVSDLRKHPAWQDRTAELLCALGLAEGAKGVGSARRWIEGWN
jgi:hypothetical protein